MSSSVSFSGHGIGGHARGRGHTMRADRDTSDTRTARTIDRRRMGELERALRSSRARLERSMVRTRLRRIASRSQDAPKGQSSVGDTPSLAHDERALAQHRDLVAAIRRIEAGTYGTCLHCGEPIAYERLAEHPEATHCTDCSTRFAPQE